MRIDEILTEQELDEISRRDFLKGAGAAVGLAAIPQISKAEEYQSRKIGNWDISIIKSKFNPTRIYALAGAYQPYYGSLVYENNNLYYSGGNGKSSSKFHMISPSSIVRYIVDNGPIQTIKSDSSGIVNFTKQIPLLVKSNKIELSFNDYNTLNYAVEKGSETEIYIDGLAEVIDFMKNFQSILSNEKPGERQNKEEIISLIRQAKQLNAERIKYIEKGHPDLPKYYEYKLAGVKRSLDRLPGGQEAWNQFYQSEYNKQ